MSASLSAAEILRELVALPTPSSVSNLPLLHWVKDFLAPRGWRVELLPYRDEAGVEKGNLIARPAAAAFESNIDLAFVCHSDTVPYSPHWQNALSLDESGGLLHGCGSCDVKGSLACFLAAASSLNGESLKSDVALLVTADEEIGCKGMDRLLAERKLHIHAAIISEPTSLRPGIAGKGYGLARVTVEGREAHSAFPERGVSAIAVAAQLIVRIQDRFGGTFAGGWSRETCGHAQNLFDPPRTTVNIGVIEGGTAKNILAGRCTFLLEWRAIPGDVRGSFVAELQALLEEVRLAEPRAGFRLEPLREETGFMPVKRGPLQLLLAELLPGEPVGISFGSEAGRVARIAEEVIVIGPGDMQTAHSERECVPRAELELWTSTLATLLHN